MSELSNIFQSIANAIKAVSGKDKKISPKNFTDEISKLSYIDDTVTGKVNIVPSAKPEITIEDNAILAVTTQIIFFILFIISFVLHVSFIIFNIFLSTCK